MAITVQTDIILAQTATHGSEMVDMSAEQWIEFRYGTPENPINIYLAQVPAGKKWKLTASVYIEETDA